MLIDISSFELLTNVRAFGHQNYFSCLNMFLLLTKITLETKFQVTNKSSLVNDITNSLIDNQCNISTLIINELVTMIYVQFNK